MKKSSSPRFLRGLLYATSGFAAAFRSEVNLRFHLVAAGLVVIAAFYFRLPALEWCVVLFCIGSVIGTELINTSLETTVDLASPQQHEKAGRAKDIAAAAVLVASVVSAIIGSIIFIPHILTFF